MDMKQLLEDHPKTAIVIKQWFLNKMLESIKDENVPEDFLLAFCLNQLLCKFFVF